MNFPPGYTIDLTEKETKEKWPNLKESENFIFTSLKKRDFTCLAFAIGEEDRDIDMTVFSKHLPISECGLDKNVLDHSVNAYVKVLSHFYKFEDCGRDFGQEQGYEKIALYEGWDPYGFGYLHTALQLPDGRWKSKMGGYEDIEHDRLEDISGDFYGNPVRCMKRPIGIKIMLIDRDSD